MCVRKHLIITKINYLFIPLNKNFILGKKVCLIFIFIFFIVFIFLGICKKKDAFHPLFIKIVKFYLLYLFRHLCLDLMDLSLHYELHQLTVDLPLLDDMEHQLDHQVRALQVALVLQVDDLDGNVDAVVYPLHEVDTEGIVDDDNMDVAGIEGKNEVVAVENMEDILQEHRDVVVLVVAVLTVDCLEVLGMIPVVVDKQLQVQVVEEVACVVGVACEEVEDLLVDLEEEGYLVEDEHRE